MKKKIGFVLLSNSKDPIPSTRIGVLNMFPFLSEHGIEPHILFEPKTGNEQPDVEGVLEKALEMELDIVYFQKVYGKSVENLVSQLSEQGIKTVYGVCDLVNDTMTKITDATIIVTSFLKSLYSEELQHKIYVVHDGIERANTKKSTFREDRGSMTNPLNAVLVTSSNLSSIPVLSSIPDWMRITIVGRYPKTMWKKVRQYRWNYQHMQLAYEKWNYLKFIVNPKIHCIPWSPEGVYKHMKRADIGIIPIDMDLEGDDNSDFPFWKVKSENRLTLKMSIGLPVVATPIPSYLPCIKQGENGYLVENEWQWLDALSALRDPVNRKTIGQRARDTILSNYSMEKQAYSLIAVLRSLI